MSKVQKGPLAPWAFCLVLLAIPAATLSGLWMLATLFSSLTHGFEWSLAVVAIGGLPFALSVSVLWLMSKFGFQPPVEPTENTNVLGPYAFIFAFISVLTMMFSGGCVLFFAAQGGLLFFTEGGIYRELVLITGGVPFLVAAAVFWLARTLGKGPSSSIDSSGKNAS